MVDIKALLEYQDTDARMARAEGELERGDEKKKMSAAYKAFNELKAEMAAAEKTAESLLGFYERSVSYYENNAKNIDELERRCRAGGDNAAKLDGALKSLFDSFTQMEARLSAFGKQISDTLNNYRKSRKAAKEQSDAYAAARDDYEKLKKSRLPEAQAMTAKLSDLKAAVGADVAAKYAALRESRVSPAVVPLSGGKYCGGCGIEVAPVNKTDLNSRGLTECQNCRRLIYKNDK